MSNPVRFVNGRFRPRTEGFWSPTQYVKLPRIPYLPLKTAAAASSAVPFTATTQYATIVAQWQVQQPQMQRAAQFVHVSAGAPAGDNPPPWQLPRQIAIYSHAWIKPKATGRSSGDAGAAPAEKTPYRPLMADMRAWYELPQPTQRAQFLVQGAVAAQPPYKSTQPDASAWNVLTQPQQPRPSATVAAAPRADAPPLRPAQQPAATWYEKGPEPQQARPSVPLAAQPAADQPPSRKPQQPTAESYELPPTPQQLRRVVTESFVAVGFVPYRSTQPEASAWYAVAQPLQRVPYLVQPAIEKVPYRLPQPSAQWWEPLFQPQQARPSATVAAQPSADAPPLKPTQQPAASWYEQPPAAQQARPSVPLAAQAAADQPPLRKPSQPTPESYEIPIPRQQARRVVTESFVEVGFVPYRSTRLEAVVDQWYVPASAAQQTRFVVQAAVVEVVPYRSPRSHDAWYAPQTYTQQRRALLVQEGVADTVLAQRIAQQSIVAQWFAVSVTRQRQQFVVQGTPNPPYSSKQPVGWWDTAPQPQQRLVLLVQAAVAVAVNPPYVSKQPDFAWWQQVPQPQQRRALAVPVVADDPPFGQPQRIQQHAYLAIMAAWQPAQPGVNAPTRTPIIGAGFNAAWNAAANTLIQGGAMHV